MSSGFRSETLTEREVEIVSLIAEGLTNKAIGNKLFLSENTVKSHIHRVFAKLGCVSRADCVMIAINRKYISSEGETVGEEDRLTLSALADAKAHLMKATRILDRISLGVMLDE